MLFLVSHNPRFSKYIKAAREEADYEVEGPRKVRSVKLFGSFRAY